MTNQDKNPKPKKGQLRTNPIYQAQDILARRDHSEYEVRTKMARKGFEPQQIDEAVAWLKENKLLNDELFAQKFVRHTLLMKPVGPRYLIQKLQQKRVAAEAIEPAVYEEITDEREEELVQAAAEQWKRSHQRHADDRNRLQRFLISRGFSFEVVQGVLD